MLVLLLDCLDISLLGRGISGPVENESASLAHLLLAVLQIALSFWWYWACLMSEKLLFYKVEE